MGSRERSSLPGYSPGYRLKNVEKKRFVQIMSEIKTDRIGLGAAASKPATKMTKLSGREEILLKTRERYERANIVPK